MNLDSVRKGVTPQAISTTLQAALDDARAMYEEGQAEDAWNLTLEVGEAASELGLLDLAGAAMIALGAFDMRLAETPKDEGRLLELKGNICAKLGDWNGALAAYQDYRSLGERVSDSHIVATAEHNLANVNASVGDFGEAAHYYRSAFSLLTENEDYYQATQALLNFAHMTIEMRDLDQSEATLAIAENLLSTVRGVPQLRSTWCLSSGRLRAFQGEFHAALGFFRRALGYSRKSANYLAQVASMQNLGAAYSDLGKFSLALKWFKKGLELSGYLGITLYTGQLHEGMGVAFYRTGRNEEAAASLNSAREVYERLGERARLSDVTRSLGELASARHDLDLARSFFFRALSLSRELHDMHGEWEAVTSLIDTELRLGNLEAAESLARIALSQHPDFSATEREILTLQLARTLIKKQPAELEDALILFEQTLAENSNALTEFAGKSALIAAELSEVGHFEQALSYFFRALEIFEQQQMQEMAIHVRNDLANTLTDSGRYSEARAEYEKCLEAAERLQNRVMSLQATFNLGEMAQREGSYEEAIARLQQAVFLARELADEAAEADALGSLGIALLKTDRSTEARRTFNQSLRIARRLRSSSRTAHAIGGLAGVAFAGNKFAKAARLYEEATLTFSKLGDIRHAAEDFGGLIESLAATGSDSALQGQVQNLVDLAQTSLLAGHAPDSIARTARWYLRREQLESAAELYAIAIALSISQNIEELPSAERFVQLLLTIAIHLRDDSRVDIASALSSLAASLDNVDSDLGATITPLLIEALQVVESNPGSDLLDP